MKKLLIGISVLFLAIGLFSQNEVVTTTVTTQNGGWYRVATNHYTAIEWQMRYTVGNSTRVTLTFARSKDNLPRTYYSERASDNTVENMTIILDDAVPVWRAFWMEIPQSADYVYVHVQFAGGNTGQLLLEGFLDYAI